MTNAEIINAIYDAFGKGDIPFILSCVGENVLWEKWTDNRAQAADVPYLREKNSVAGVAEFFGEVGKLGVKSSRVIAIMDGGDKFAVEFEIETERFGFEQEMHLWTFDNNGKIVGFRHYLDTAKHIAANEKYRSAGA
jgi:ketosteroid isomerase-like protein